MARVHLEEEPKPDPEKSIEQQVADMMTDFMSRPRPQMFTISHTVDIRDILGDSDARSA